MRSARVRRISSRDLPWALLTLPPVTSDWFGDFEQFGTLPPACSDVKAEPLGASTRRAKAIEPCCCKYLFTSTVSSNLFVSSCFILFDKKVIGRIQHRQVSMTSSPTKTIRILLVDDHTVVRSALRILIDSQESL